MAMSRFNTFAEDLNDKVARSAVGRWFRLEGCGHPLARKGSRFTTEVRAGLTTAAAMLYIISVNANILTNTGGPCVERYCQGNPDACLASPEFALCKQEVQRDYTTATSAIAFVASFLMGLLANLPLGLAPGLGVNAYFAFTVVGFNGTGSITFGEATAAVFVEGIIFMALSLFGVRQWLARLIPRSLSLATGAGIGLFLAIIGLSPSGGLGVIGIDPATIIGLGGCPAEYLDPDTGACRGHVLQNPTIWLGVFLGGILTAYLLMYRVRGAFLWPILLVAIASWPRSSSVTLFPHTPEGDSAFNFFKKVVTAPKLTQLGPSNLDFGGLKSGKGWLAVITFLYVDLLDLNGTLLAMTRQAGLLSELDNDFENSSAAFLTDSACIVFGSLLNLSPSTAFVESAAGIAEGGKGGIAAIVTSLVFFLSLFVAPIFASIPSYATGSTLIIIGSLMAKNLAQINYDDIADALPSFLIVVGIPFLYNISYGSIAGIVAYICLNVPTALVRRINPAWAPNIDLKEPYSLTRKGDQGGALGFLPGFVRKILTGQPRFWEYTDDEIDRMLEGRRLTALRTQAAQEQRAAAREAMRSAIRETGAIIQEEPNLRVRKDQGDEFINSSSSKTSAEASHDVPHLDIESAAAAPKAEKQQ